MMKHISGQQFEQIIDGAEVLVTDKGRLKILATDDEIIKIFIPRKTFTSSRIWPHANRFCYHANKLHGKQIKTVNITGCYRCKDKNVDLVTYKKEPGIDLREACQKNINTLEQLAPYLAHLHEKGIFFRGIHLGNVLLQDDGMCLLDIISITHLPFGVPFFHRYRNIKHLFAVKEDIPIFQQFGYEKFLQQYFQHATFPPKLAQKILHKWLLHDVRQL